MTMSSIVYNIRRYRWALLVAGLLVSACQRQDPILDNGPESAAILIAPGEVTSTKAMLNQAALDYNGTQIKVYDYLSEFTGTIKIGEVINSYDGTTTFKYFSDDITYNNTGDNPWPYLNADTEYRWTHNGKHSFFGWLVQDGNDPTHLSSSALFGNGLAFNEASRLLTVPQTILQQTSPQYDFLYSQITKRDASVAVQRGTVDLTMKHLFSAVSLNLENKSESSSVTIKSISTVYEGTDRDVYNNTLERYVVVHDNDGTQTELFPNKGSATIDYSGDSPQVTYTVETVEAKPFFSLASTLTSVPIAPKEQYDLLSGTKLKDNNGAAIANAASSFYLTWPLTADQISPTTKRPQATDIFGESIEDPKNAVLALTYEVAGQTFTSRVKFPSLAWEPGKKMQFNIEFTDKSIRLNVIVLPWDYNVFNMDFSSESVSTDGGSKLRVATEGVDPDVEQITFGPSLSSVQCKVHIRSLLGASLVIKAKGDSRYFSIEPDVMTITGGEMFFTVAPNSTPTEGVTRRIQLSFVVVLPDGREIDADTELIDNDRNYVFIRN